MFRKRNKIFCIGFNKTGTTSLEKALRDLGFKMGAQREAELMFHDWVKRDFSKLQQYCKRADAFQDAPFSFPYTFIYLDQVFKGSKFILTVRNSADEWYNSLVTFHSKLWGDGKVPTKESLLEADYLYKGYPYWAAKLFYNTPDDDLYNKDMLVRAYNRHNETVEDYFMHRKDDLLVLNLKEKGSYEGLCSFIGKDTLYEDFPWENKT